jgi:hypothetical protein
MVGAAGLGSAGGEAGESGECGGEVGCPGPCGVDAEPDPAAAPGPPPRGRREPGPQFLRLPPAGGAVEGEQLGPGEQVGGQGDELAPQLVLGEAAEREVAQAGVLGAADPSPGGQPVCEGKSLAFAQLRG